MKGTLSKCGWLLLSVLLSARAQAANGTWVTNGNGNWDTNGNWSGSTIADGQDNTADFSTINITSGRTVNLDSSHTIGSLKFGDSTPTHDWTLNSPGGSVLTLQVSSGTPTIEIVNQGTSVSLELAGTQGFTKAGVGTLTLSGNNASLSGGITISQGTVFWNANNALGSGTVTLNDANTGANNTSLFRNSTGTLANNITVANQGSGSTTIGSDSGASGSTYSGTITLNRDVSLKAGGTSTARFNGDITGSGGVTITGGGVVLFQTTAKTYTGGTTLVSGGTLQLGANNVIPDSGTFTFAGGILDGNNRTDTLGPLSLTADSTLNFGAATAREDIIFSSALTYGSGTLNITGWDGPSGSTYDRIIILSDPTASGILGHIQFAGYDLGANWFSDTGEIVPVPEPINVALGIFGVVFAGIGFVRRFRKGKAEQLRAETRRLLATRFCPAASPAEFDFGCFLNLLAEPLAQATISAKPARGCPSRRTSILPNNVDQTVILSLGSVPAAGETPALPAAWKAVQPARRGSQLVSW